MHHTGWPVVMQELSKLSNKKGILLDDFADASFTYKMVHRAYDKPWVGIFHHPVSIDSPLQCDTRYILRNIESDGRWLQSKRWLRGAVALCDEVAEDLRRWLNIPVESMWHPATSVPTESCWSLEDFTVERRLLQVGYCFRNTQAIYLVPELPAGYSRTRLLGGSEHYINRDKQLWALIAAGYPGVNDYMEVCSQANVQTIVRASNDEYDKMLASSVVLTWLYGTAANNLVVECMVRGTPLLVNRLPPVVQYLGEDYPLYIKTLDDVPALLSNHKLLHIAHAYLLARSDRIPTMERFAKVVTAFVNRVETGLGELDKRKLRGVR